MTLACDWLADYPDSHHVCDEDACCECGSPDHCCGHSRCATNAAQQPEGSS